MKYRIEKDSLGDVKGTCKSIVGSSNTKGMKYEGNFSNDDFLSQ